MRDAEGDTKGGLRAGERSSGREGDTKGGLRAGERSSGDTEKTVMRWQLAKYWYLRGRSTAMTM